jgi:uncharacterized glyoxalase superfamily protein PhnB
MKRFSYVSTLWAAVLLFVLMLNFVSTEAIAGHHCNIPATYIDKTGILVKDVDGVSSFYIQTLGFTLTQSITEKGRMSFASLKLGSFHLSFFDDRYFKTVSGGMRPGRGGANAIIEMETTQLASLYEKLKNKVKIAQPYNTNILGASSFGIADPEGNLIIFLQPAE